jgi:ketosteroid isomerase-like protein
MLRATGFVLLFAISSSAMAMPPTQDPTTHDSATHDSAMHDSNRHDPNRVACEVWQREMAFAHSVQRHDAAAFAAFLADDAVFDANTGKPTRGAEAVRQHWAAIIAGKTVHLEWYPQHVVAAANGALAYSSGVYLFEKPMANAKPRYVTGHFSTAWRRDADDVWRVAFDGGDEGKPASEAEARAFRAGRQDTCPMVTVAELPTIRH